MKTLVTASTGFAGSHMLQYLKQNTDDSCYGLSRSSATSNDTLCCDLSDAAAVNTIISQLEPELIFHMAGSFSNNFDIDFSNNVHAAKNILDAVINNGLSTRVLLMGSAAEYGEISAHENPVSENHTLRPISIYGWSKAAQTQLASVYASTHGVNVSVARTFNLKGNGISEQLFVGRVEQQIKAVLDKSASRITVGNTQAKRDYIDIKDACRMYHLIATRGIAGEVYNVGSGKAITMKDLLQEMLQHAGLDYGIVDEESTGKATPHSQVSVIYADINKLNTLCDNV